MQYIIPQEDLSELKTFRDLVRFGATQFNAAGLHFGHGTVNAWDEAIFLILYVLHLTYADLPHIVDTRLTTKEKQNILQLFKKRIDQRIPAPYLTGESWFMELPFYVTEAVLIPRSSIAELIAARFSPWTDGLHINHILDIGTGSGCIAIACALAFPEAAVDAVDISLPALEVAKKNVARHAVGEQVRLRHSDLFAAIPNETYDLIVANPPYVGDTEFWSLPQEYFHEPRLALVAEDQGLAMVTRILKQAARHLTSNGVLIVEVGNSEDLLVQKYPKAPFLWLEFERGEGGVFLLTKEQLGAAWNI